MIKYKDKKPKLEDTNALLNMRRRIKNIKNGQHNCNICPPWEGENSVREPKHGVKKPKYKKHRRVQP